MNPNTKIALPLLNKLRELNILLWTTLILFSCSIFYILNYSTQNNFISIILPYILGFTCYMFLIQKFNTERYYTTILITALTIRLLSLFAFPNLSEDIYRFWWDGNLIKNGINPFTFTPKEIIDHNLIQGEKINYFFTKLNSPDYNTVYPSLCQLLFYLGVKFSGDNIYLFSILLKLFFLIVECLSYRAISQLFNLSKYLPIGYLYYLLNPLVIIEGYGNLHFEILMSIFLLLTFYFVLSKKSIHKGISLGLSIMSKMTTGILSPLFLLKNKIIDLKFALSLGLIISSFALFILPLDQNLEGYKLYFRQFEFNSSAFILLSRLLIFLRCPELWDYRGLILMFLFVLFYFVLLFKNINYQSTIEEFMKLSFFIYSSFLLFNSTIHPWYFIPLLAIGLYSFPFTSIYASFIVVTSYSYYDHSFIQYFEWIRIFEYITLFSIFIYEKRTPILTNRGS